jgi:hypothetical protein
MSRENLKELGAGLTLIASHSPADVHMLEYGGNLHVQADDVDGRIILPKVVVQALEAHNWYYTKNGEWCHQISDH